jgi:transcriptional regulator GlxA family with amidase domain
MPHDVLNDTFRSFQDMTRELAFLLFPGFQLLDAAGPIAAFEIANRDHPDTYKARLIAGSPGETPSSSGATLHTESFGDPKTVDTLIVAGGYGTREALDCVLTFEFVRQCAVHSRRVASVCSGSYILAAAGLLNGRSATTHWSRSADFARRYPRVRLDPDRIFTRDGKFWTSAGITAGIDLALALIEEDLGEITARRTAQQLVVYHRRPGGQSQFSALLDLDNPQGRFAPLLEFIRSHLTQDLGVETLAARVCLSPRHFSREFQRETGMSPAKAVERLRADAARAALESGMRSVQEVARLSGFEDPQKMRRAFARLFGGSPSSLKQRRGPQAQAL